MKVRFAAIFGLAIAAANAQKIEVTVERQEGDQWLAVEPARVFASGDRLRFRCTTSVPGFLYVMNHGTAGTWQLLFPQKETGTENRMEKGSSRMVPATQGAFTVTGPPGHDIVYWLVSPVPLANGWPEPPKSSVPPASFRPRCDDTVFKSRGDCVDSTAGLKPAKTLPTQIRPRELNVSDDQKGKATTAAAAPVIYELRLAHR